MLEKLKKISLTKIKRTNFKAFSFFLLFSLLIWILVQFSKKYEEKFRVGINYINAPNDKIISDEPVFLDMKMEASGFKIAWASLFHKKLTLDLSKMPAEENTLVFDVGDNTKEVREQLGLALEDVAFLNETIYVGYRHKTVKTVPVISQIKTEFRPGYGSNDSLEIFPDSIKISGTEEQMANIKSLYTIPFKLEKVNADVSGTIAVDTSGLGRITFYRKKVDYKLEVEKFTEGKVEVPISVINGPQNSDIVVFPKTLEIVFKVSLENYGEIAKNDFRVVCDYGALKEGQNFFIPQVVQKPGFVTDLRLSINKVQFVLKK